MLHLMNAEESRFCAKLVENLRLEIYQLNRQIHSVDLISNEQLDPKLEQVLKPFFQARDRDIKRRNFCAQLIKDLREVLVSPPSLETRIISFINRVLSFRVI